MKVLEDSKKEIEQICLHVPVSIWWTDKDQNYLGCNMACCALLGLPPQAILGKTIFEIGKNDDSLKSLVQETSDANAHIIKTGIPSCGVSDFPVRQLCAKIPLYNEKETEIIGLLSISIPEHEYDYRFTSQLDLLMPEQFILQNHSTINLTWNLIFNLVPCGIWWVNRNHKPGGYNFQTLRNRMYNRKWQDEKPECMYEFNGFLMDKNQMEYNVKKIVSQDKNIPSIGKTIIKKPMVDRNDNVNGLIGVEFYYEQFDDGMMESSLTACTPGYLLM